MDRNKELTFITNLLSKNKIQYWLNNGTLLGIYREGKVLEHDKDIDISAWNTEEDKIIQLLKYFNEIIIKDNFFIPKETEKYLELHYGN